MVEVLVAISIITVAILSAMAVSEKAVQVSRQAFHSEQAAFLLEEGAEIVRILRDNDWANISSLTPGSDYFTVFAGGTWTLSSTPNTKLRNKFGGMRETPMLDAFFAFRKIHLRRGDTDIREPLHDVRFHVVFS